MVNNKVGKTKDVGFEIGVRKTVLGSIEKVWNYFFSKKGIRIWLGELNSINFEIGKPYKTKDGIEGIIKVFKPYSHIRLTWKKKDWDNPSTLQVRFINAKSGITISFHQEHLLDSKQREEMKLYWYKVLENLSA